MRPAKPRLLFIDGLRGIAAVMVMAMHFFWHISEVRWPQLFPLVGHGRYGVSIFFVVSGFVICYSLRNASITWPFALRYVVRRSIRLDPPYWAVIAATLALGYSPLTWGRLASHLTYLQALAGYDHYWGIFWTLCIEIQFYIFFLLLRCVSDRSQVPLAVLASPLFFYSLATSGWPTITEHPALSFNAATWIGPHFASFYLGILAAQCFSDPAPRNQRFLQATFALTATRLAISFDPAHCYALATALAIHCAALSGGMYTWLSGSLFQFFGRISYSLYLWHMLANFTIYHLTGSGPTAMLGSIVVATLAYYLIELPAKHLASMVPR